MPVSMPASMLGHRFWYRLLAMVVVLLLGSSDQGQAQASTNHDEFSGHGETRQRIQRLQDLSAVGMGWNPALPQLDTTGAQRGLQTSAYRLLRAELMLLTAFLADDASLTADAGSDDETRLPPQLAQRFSALQTTIRARAEANINAGYYYAAGVYIDMFEQARGEPTVSRELRFLLVRQRVLNVPGPALGAISVTAP
jgi:hypothetical protein